MRKFQKNEVWRKGDNNMKIFTGKIFKNCMCSVEFIYLYALLSFVELQVVIIKSLPMR
jgi:hypothetical protein